MSTGEDVPTEGRDKVAECRALLRDFRTPDRLRYNSLAMAIVSTATSISERRVLLESVVEDALSRLEARERTIVHRCDIEHEPFSAVARDLGISERHLYREHRRILELLVGAIADASHRKCLPNLASATLLEDRLRTCRALEENGAEGVAAAILDEMSRSAPDNESKCALLLRLTELNARFGRFSVACEVLEEASRAARATNETLLAQLHLTRAHVFDECGQGQSTVYRSALAAAELLRKTGSYRYDDKAAMMLASSLALIGFSFGWSGDLNGLARATEEVSTILPLIRRPDEDLLIAVFSLTADFEALCNVDLGAGCQNFMRAATVARNASFTLTSITCLTSLANVQRADKQFDAALITMTDLPVLARELRNPNVLLAVLIEFANLYADVSDWDNAQALLIEAASLHVENESLRAAMLRTCAKVNVATNNFDLALDQARTAEGAFAAQGRQGMSGVPLRLQAEALLGLGDRKGAYRAISSAIDTLSSRSTRLLLQDAYRVLNRVRRNPQLPAPADKEPRRPFEKQSPET